MEPPPPNANDDQNHKTFTKFRRLPKEIIGYVLALLPMRELVRLRELSSASADTYFTWALTQVQTAKFEAFMNIEKQAEICQLLARHARSSLRELYLPDYGPITRMVRSEFQ